MSDDPDHVDEVDRPTADEPAGEIGGPAPPFVSLDYLYMPSGDVAADARHLVDVLGGRLVFAIDAMGTRVAMVALTETPPRILLADHLDGHIPILIFRVPDLGRALDALAGRGWKRGPTLEIPPGPCCSFFTPGGQRIAVYERTRPGVEASFAGRRDF